MKILLLGGAGFVGQNLNERLTSEGHTCRIYDKKVPRQGSGYCGDIQDVEMLTEYMKGADLVFHLASNADIAKAAIDPTIDFIEGTQLTQKVLEAMRRSGVKRLVYFSGSGVYGENRMETFTEDHGPLLPISPYGASKLASEAMISAYCHMFGMQAKVLRPANIVGPNQTHGVVFDFIKRLKEDPSKLRILGDGSQTKSYVHIDDVMAAVDVVTADWSAPFDVFNLATDDYISVQLIALIVTDMMGIKGCQFEFTGGDRGWNGDVPVIRFDCSKIKKLGWQAKHSSPHAITLATAAML